MSLRAIGECVGVEQKPWSMDGRSGVTRKIWVQTSRRHSIELRVPDGVTLPYDGQQVDLAVEPRMSEGEGRRASMQLSVVGDYPSLYPVPHARSSDSTESAGRRAASAAASS